MSFATSLEDLKRGRKLHGDQFKEASVSSAPQPDWFDKSKFESGRQFFANYCFSLSVSYYFALLVGFVIPELSRVLLVTEKSKGAKSSGRRYVRTYVHVILWHVTNILEPQSGGFKSLREVRNMHDNARRKMEAKYKGDGPYVSQYDMALVQCGFIVGINYNKDFGPNCTDSELEDYVFFWRVMGYLLGIRDEFNVCSLGLKTAQKICKEVEEAIIKPGLKEPPWYYAQLSADFVEGVTPVLSRNAALNYVCGILGIEGPRMDSFETIQLWLLRAHLFLVSRFKPYRLLFDRIFFYFVVKQFCYNKPVQSKRGKFLLL